MAQSFSRFQTEAAINIHAWKDPAFKKKLLTNPIAALQEMGVKNIPDTLKITTVKEEKNCWCIVVHEPPENYESLSEEDLMKRLSDEDLMKVSAAWDAEHPQNW